jgi:hypothetical protein
MVRATLEYKLPLPHRPLLARVEAQNNLTLQDDSIVRADGTVHGRPAIGREVRDTEIDTRRRAARDHISHIGHGHNVGHRHGCAYVKGAESGAGGPDGVELRDDGIRGEDGRTPSGVARDDQARSWELGVGADGRHIVDRFFY